MRDEFELEDPIMAFDIDEDDDEAVDTVDEADLDDTEDDDDLSAAIDEEEEEL